MPATMEAAETLSASAQVNMLRYRGKPSQRSDPMTPEEDELAAKLYAEFWTKHPTIKNPSDINRTEKAEFLILKGFESIKLMQRARKQAKAYSRPFDDDDTGDDAGE